MKSTVTIRKLAWTVRGAVFLTALLVLQPLWTEHALIDLKIVSPHGQAEAFSDQEPPQGGVNPRPQLEVQTGAALVLNFILTSAYPHGALKDIEVRYFVVRTSKVEQQKTPDLSKGAVTQGRVVMNLKPKARVGARLSFEIDKPGTYRARVETRNTKADHEHFSAIDLVVK